MRPFRNLVVLAGLLGATLASAASASASSPRLNLILPRGVQRGTESVMTFSGGTLADAAEILFYAPGFEVTKIEAKDANTIAATVKVAADCRLGEHVAQVRTKSGISDYRTFYVGALPIVAEKEPNTDFAAPQALDLNVTVHGVIDAEDVDYYVVQAKKGQRISAEIEAMRLGVTLFDPYIAILDSKRFELAADDDTPLLQQDAAVSIIAPADGPYIVQVRDSAYGGNGSCYYNLHVGTFPRPTAVYPAGGKIGEPIDVKFVGDAAGEIPGKFSLPPKVEEEYGLLASVDGQVAPSENAFRLSEFGNALEVEPNDAVATATPATVPVAFNGIIQAPGDIDFFKFTAKQGQVFDVECFGRRIRSSLDPVMYLYNAQGGGLVGNDDARGPDSYFQLTIPADGEYLLSVTDHLGRGGADFVYRVEMAPVKASLTVGIPRVERYGQFRQQIYVPRGNRFGALMTVSRLNFSGPVVFEPLDLPAGVKMVTEEMPASLSAMPVVFEAAADAPVAGKLVDFRARHSDPKANISGGFYNRADFVVAEPGQSLYRWRDVNKVAIAVVDELPYTLEIVQPKVPIVRDGAMNLKIVAHRKEGFVAPINVEFPFAPPGIGAASSVQIPQGQNEVLYPLSANSAAEIRKWPIFVLGSADVGGAAYVASQMATLEIVEPFVQLAIERADVELGKQTEVFCKVTVTKPFEGTAKVQLIGLPAKVTTTEMEINKDSKEFAFKVATDPGSPVGSHKGLFCQVTVVQNAEPIIHARVGDTELRIDQPLPPAANAAPMPQPAAAPAAAPATPAPAPEKRLTRLEKLRLEAMQRAEGTAPAAK